MDAMTINQTTDIAALVGNLKKSGRYHVGPCPFCGGSDRFNVKRGERGQLWICRQCGDGKYKDAVAFLMKRDGLTFTELVGEPSTRPLARTSRRSTSPRPEPRPVELVEPPSEDWQIAALLAVAECCQTLHDQETAGARRAMRYLLENRGLSPETIRAASLGYNEEWRDVGGKRLAPGIAIPAYITPHLWYIKVKLPTKLARELARKRGIKKPVKYLCVNNSMVLYGAGDLLGKHTAVVTEGEFDCLLLRQHLPAGFTAVTMGSGAKSLPTNPTWLRWFAAVRRVFVVMDNDKTGAEALEKWRALLPWVEPLAVPAGHNDITDFWAAGEDMGEFVAMITGGNECI